MVALQVMAVSRDRARQVTGLCGPGWSQPVGVVMEGIRKGTQHYYVVVGGQRASLRVAEASVYSGAYLRTTSDTVHIDLLDTLPTGCR